MKIKVILGLITAVSTVGAAYAAPVAKKSGIRVVAGAKALTQAEKASVNGLCDCDTPSKPGYGFGAKVEHYGPPGQGFSPDWTWRQQVRQSDHTPKGTRLPPPAFNPRPISGGVGGDCGSAS